MSKQNGFIYESNACNLLKSHNIVPVDFTPAGNLSDTPDLLLQKANKVTGCELKITTASAGSIVIKYDCGSWIIGGESDDPEKIFITSLSKQFNLIETLNTNWTYIPYKYVFNSETVGLTKRQIYAREKARYNEINSEICPTFIESYYNKKKTHYINIGTHGFYLLGRKNPFGFENIPVFSESATARYRARVQSKGGGNYQFTFEMAFNMTTRSPVNIAPIKSRRNVEINTQALDLTWYHK